MKFVGRNRELEVLSSLLDSAGTGKGQASVVTGEAGVGKTALLGQVKQEASQRGFIIREIQCDPSRQFAPFGIVLSLLDDTPSDYQENEADQANQANRTDQIGGQPLPILRHVLATIRTGPEAPHDAGTQPLSLSTVGTAFLAHLCALAQVQPLLVVIDDVQWADPSSAATLSFVARRLLADRVVMVFGLRTSRVPLDGHQTDAPKRVSDETRTGRGPSFDRRGLTEIELQTMTESESVTVLKSLGCSATDAMQAAPRAAGLPLALTELAVRLRDNTKHADVPLSLPQHYSDLMAGLSSDLKTTVQICALNDEFRVVLGVIGPSANEHLEQAESLGILSLQPDRIAFRHPLVRAAVLNTCSKASERELHRQIVKALDAKSDADAIAHHLASGADDIDDAAATALTEFADRAQRRGAHAEAASAYLRASMLCSDPNAQAQCLLNSGRTLYFGGDAHTAIETAEKVLTLTNDPAIRADAVALLGNASMWERDPRETSARLLAIAAEVREQEPIRAAWAFISVASMAFLGEDLSQGIAYARLAEQIATEHADGIAALAASGIIAWNLFLTGKVEEAQQRSSSVDPVIAFLLSRDTIEGISYGQTLAMRLVMQERFVEAEELLNRLLPMAQRLGVNLSAAVVSMILGELRWRQGRADQALVHSMHYLDQESLPSLSFAWACAAAAHLHASSGDAERTESLAGQSLSTASAEGSPLIRAWAFAALGRLRLSQARLEEALVHFDQVRSLVSATNLEQPEFFMWQGDYLETLVLLGHREAAEKVLQQLRAQNVLLNLHWVRGIIHRTEAALAVDAQNAGRLFGESTNAFVLMGMPFEVARTRFCEAQSMERFGRSGREHFADARRLFARVGSRLWEQRCAPVLHPEPAPTEVKLSSDRPSQSVTNHPSTVSLHVLSEAERRVAIAAGSGRTNSDIAQELYVSIRTIEFHLGTIYRKLGLKNRAALINFVVRDVHS